jgi:hypothetical protein
LGSAIIFSITNRGKVDEKIGMALTWMLEKNQKHMDWLQERSLAAVMDS